MGGSRRDRAPLGALIVSLAVIAFVFSPLGVASAGSAPWVAFGEASSVRLGEGPNPWAIQLVSDADPGWGGVAFFPRETLTLAGLWALSLDFVATTGDCGGGSPRIQLAIDTDGDGFRNGNVFVYLGQAPSFNACNSGWQSSGNLIGLPDSDMRYDLTQFGGAFYGTYWQALSMLGTDTVLWVFVVADASWLFGTQVVLVDNLVVNDRHLSAKGFSGGMDSSGGSGSASSTTSTGFDGFGYNDNARVFVGTGISWCMGKLGWDLSTCTAYMDPYGFDRIVMKWNAEWDRGNAENWANPPYAAWTSNHWNGNTEGGSGAVWQYKIIWVGADLESSPYWRPGGYAIWGEFEVVMDQGHDPFVGTGHIWFAHAISTGYGGYGGAASSESAATASAESSCATIQDGGLVDSMGNPLVLGFDPFGYNYQAHLFVGTYDGSDRTLDGTYWGQTGDFVDDMLMMKWSDDWLANRDCNGDGKLDRGTDFVTSLGWLTNHVVGDYDSDGDGIQDAHYTDFVKIVWVGPGGDLWGQYHIVQEVWNDPMAGFHGLYSKEGSPGFGLNDGWTALG